MAIMVISVELVPNLGILVHFSDKTTAFYSADELSRLRPFRKDAPRPDSN